MINFLRDFKISDIINYEMSEDINLFDELGACETYVIHDLIKISLGCNDEDANNILVKQLENNELAELCIYVCECLVGKRASDNDNTVDIKKYNSFSDILEDFFTEIQGIDTLQLSDFLNMTTRYMYRYSEGIKNRYINRKNSELQSQYNNASMVVSALAGKLKECPQYDESGNIKKSGSLVDTLLAMKASAVHKNDDGGVNHG